MAGNTTPIFSRVGDISGSVILTTAAADFTGQSINNSIVYQADPTNGGFLQRLRFKAIGANVATVARIYINEGYVPLAPTAAAPTMSGQSTLTTGGTLQPGTYYAKMQSIDQWGAPSAMSTEVSQVTTGTTSTITWAWGAVTGAASYRLFVGPATNSQVIYFPGLTGTSYTQTTATINLATNLPAQGNPSDFLSNNIFYGEISLPATSVTAGGASAGVDVDYPMNIALPPGYHIIVGLGTTVAAGWTVSAIAGKY